MIRKKTKMPPKPPSCLLLLAFAQVLILFSLDTPLTAAQEIPVPIKRPAAGSPAPAENKSYGQAPQTVKSIPLDETAVFDCEQRMQALNVGFKRMDSIREENGCGIDIPYEVNSVAGSVAITPPAILACETAVALAEWVSASAQPYAGKLPENRKLAGLQNASGYVCRQRNNNPDAKLSQHALGRAIDISAFLFDDGSQIAIEPRQRTGSAQEAYQKAVRFAACLHFTTVLGPYSDASHNDHLHLDIAKRRAGYRLCDFPGIRDDEAQED